MIRSLIACLWLVAVTIAATVLPFSFPEMEKEGAHGMLAFLFFPFGMGIALFSGAWLFPCALECLHWCSHVRGVEHQIGSEVLKCDRCDREWLLIEKRYSAASGGEGDYSPRYREIFPEGNDDSQIDPDPAPPCCRRSSPCGLAGGGDVPPVRRHQPVGQPARRSGWLRQRSSARLSLAAPAVR